VVARFNTLGGIAADSYNNLYVGDSNLLRYVNMENTFVASTVPGLQVWLDGADPLATGTAPANGTVISTWNDKSGNARNATSVGSPAYNSSSGAIVLNGTSQGFSLTYSGIHAAETCFAVINMTTPTGIGYFIETGISYARQFYNYNGSLAVGQTNIGTKATNLNTMIANSNTILGYTLNSTNSFFFFNGMPGPTGTAFSSVPSETTLYIGYTGSAGYLSGTISEVLIYDQVLSASQRQQVEGYLAAKWRITLPTTHPYFGMTTFSASVTGVVAGNGTASNVPGVGSNTSLTSPLDVAVVNGSPFITAGTSFFSYTPSSGYLNTFLQSTGNSNQANINASSNISTQTISGVATTTIFGSGINTVNTNVRYSAVIGITCDSNNTVYVGDKYNIRAINSTGAVTTVVGQPNNTGSITDTGAFPVIGGGTIYGVCVDNSGNIYFTQVEYNSLMKYTVSTGVLTTLLSGSPLSNPRGMVYDGSRYIYMANYGGTNANGHGNIIRYDTIANTATVIGSNTPGFTPSGVVSIAINGAKTLVFIGDNNNSMIWVLNISVLSIAAFVILPVRPYSLACDSVGNIFAQQAQQIYKTTIQFPPSGGIVGSAPTLFATTTATAGTGMTVDTNNNVYLTDINGNVIWRITQNAVATIYSGNGLSGKNDSSYISSLTIIGQINAPQGFSGNLGINCNAPQHALDVTGIIHTNRTLFSDGELIVGTSNQTAYLRTTVQGGATYIQSGTALESLSVAPLFFTGMYGGPMLMALTATGLGIGTSAPGYKLDVVGDINFTGNLRQNGVIFSGGGGSGNLAITGSVTVNNFAFNQGGAGVNASLGNVLIGSNASGHGVIQTNGSQNSLLIGGITDGGTVQIWLNNLRVDCNVGFGVDPGTFRLNVSGNTNIDGVLTLKTNVSHTSVDGINRLYYGHNSITYFGSPAGYYFQTAAGVNTFIIDNAGSVTASGNILTPGVLTAQANMIIATGVTASQARAKLHIRGGVAVGQASGTINHIAFESESAGYNHYITTTHAASSSSLNAIHFWLNNTTQGATTTAGTGNLNNMSITAMGAIVRADVPYASVGSFANLFANAQLVVKQISADSCLYLANGNTNNAGSGSVIQSSSGGSSGTGTNLGINPFGGSVGIGTNSPGYTLDVVGRINASNDVNIGFTGAGFMRFTTAGGATYIQSSTTPLTGTGAATGNFAPIYFTGMAGAENKMALTNTGLGIGTTTPEYKLDVNGTTRLNGVVRFQSDVYHKSLDGIDRFYFQQNGITYFKSGNGSFRFQNSASTLDIVSIDNDGNVGARGAINSTSNLTAVNGHFNVFNSNITGYVGAGIVYGRGAYSTVAHVIGNTRGFIVADYGFLNDQWNFVFNAHTNNAAWAIDNGALGTSRIAMQSGSIVFLFGNAGQAPTTTVFTVLGTGNATLSGSLSENSDIRLKENIVTIDSCLDKVNALRGVYFTRKDTPEIRKIGFIAQEVEQVLPEVVFEDSSEEKIKSIAYQNIVPVLIEAIKEQNTTITSLQAQVASQQSTINAILAKLNI